MLDEGYCDHTVAKRLNLCMSKESFSIINFADKRLISKYNVNGQAMARLAGLSA